uniref:BPL/LPL catalytic domain-containing protein n=1 Tax=Scylla olivacea TaxID=85551 RepID=A0A0P4VYC8_SCYOL
MICQGIQPPQPGKREQDMVREAAQYYQRALDAAHVRQEGFKREQSSASDEDFSFSGSRDRVVVTQEPIRYPVRIRSEADLTRATSIIRDNLANIIQNYLFKPGTSPESQPLVSHLALDHPTIKLVGTNEREVGSRISTSGSTESKEGSSPPPLVVAAGGQTPMAPFAPVQKAPLFRSKASPQHPLSKPRSSSPGSTIQMVCLPSPHQKAELTSGMSPCVVKKEKQPFTSSSKVTGKYPARGDKRLTKSEEIVLPPFIRESHIDVPVTAEDDLTSNSSTADLGSTAEYPHPQQATTTSTGHKEKKFDAASKKSVEVDAKYVTATSKESLQIGSPTEESADIIAKNQEIALSSADRSCVTRILETVPPSDIQKADIVPSTERAMVQKMKNGAVVSTPTESISSLQDTVSLPTTSDALINSSQSVASAPKMDTIPDIAMIPPTPDTDTDSAPGTVMTSVTPDTDITPMTPDKDIAQATQGMNMTEETSETTKTPATLSNDTVLIMSDIKTPDLIQTYLDVSKEAVATNIVSKVSDADTTITSPTTSDIGRKDEGHSRVVTQAGKDEADDVYCPESVVTIVHDGCISPIVENNLSWEGSSLASESQGESIQRPRCLKDTHKLNTKSSTASESSFESLPYRMLTSQPESLTEDVSNSVSIELTRPPPETERLRAARLELIRQERIHAISLMSTVTTDSEEGQVWAASLEEQPFGSPMIENNNQETWDSPVLDSGVEVALKETCIDHSTKPQHCSPTSPTESAPESGFSSLQETVVEGSARGARSGVCLSKSKDSLDLTDGERCAGTDTFSDDMETLSSSAGEATLMESGPVSQRASPRNSVSDSVHHDSSLAVPTHEVSQHEGMREAAMSNPNLQRSSSPLVRGMSHSSTFSSSPLRRPSSATPAYSPAKRGLCSSTGGSQVGEVGGMPLMRVEEEGPQRKNLDSATDKPPNILVYAANNAEYYEKVKQTLGRCLNPDRYTIYHLTDELAFKSPWSGSTTLLVVCGDVPAHISTVFIRYLLKGGRVLSVCSDFLNMAVPLFGTVEVQEQAVVSVSYQRWNSVHLLHHQHCFHSSPRNKRFSRNTEMPSKDPTNRSAVSVEPTHVEIIDEYGGRHRLDLRVLATDDTWGAPTLLSAKVHDGQGTAVFSQVHLEHDPQASLPATSEATNQLAGSNMARLEILQELLATELSLDISSHPSIAYTPAYFLGRHELKEELLNHLQPHMVGERLQRSHTSIEFVKPGNVPKQPAHNLLPILTSACPLTFSTVKYFETLATTSLGRLVIYCEVMSSSMRVVAGNPPLVHGLVVIPTQQTHGQGRGGNVWLSPLGCAMFSIQFHFHLSSPLGQHLSFLQHLVAMSVVQAVVTLPGYNDIPLHLKWPNDIYLGSNLKIGGVVVEATTAGPQVIANVGCGVNLSNSNPTGCINDAIRQYNQEHNTELAEFEREVFLARVFNALEELIHTFQTQGPGAVQHIYYKYWLHSNAVVTVQSEHRHTQSAEVVGVDSYGFLQARLPSGETITLQPDGNSFDMMEGLVYSKVK